MSMCSSELAMNTMKPFLWIAAETQIKQQKQVISVSISVLIWSPDQMTENILSMCLQRLYFCNTRSAFQCELKRIRGFISHCTHYMFQWTRRMWAATAPCFQPGYTPEPGCSAAALAASWQNVRGRSWSRRQPPGSAAQSAGQCSSAKCSAPVRGWWRN